MRCLKHDSFMDDVREEWTDAPCDDPTCAYCKDRPKSPEKCPRGPCSGCRHLALFVPRIRLARLKKEIDKHPVGRLMLETFLERSEYDRRYQRLRIVCRHTGVESSFDGGYAQSLPKNPNRPDYAGTDTRPFSPLQAQVWWQDWLAELPDDAERPPRRHFRPEQDEYDYE